MVRKIQDCIALRGNNLETVLILRTPARSHGTLFGNILGGLLMDGTEPRFLIVPAAGATSHRVSRVGCEWPEYLFVSLSPMNCQRVDAGCGAKSEVDTRIVT